MILIPFLYIVTVLPHDVSLVRRSEKTSARRGFGAPTVQLQSISNQIKSIKPLEIHQTCEYGFPQKGPQNSLYRMLRTTLCAPRHESMFHPGFGSQI